jgi:hypothetical protein
MYREFSLWFIIAESVSMVAQPHLLPDFVEIEMRPLSWVYLHAIKIARRLMCNFCSYGTNRHYVYIDKRSNSKPRSLTERRLAKRKTGPNKPDPVFLEEYDGSNQKSLRPIVPEI